ncbi:(Phosphotyrosine protein) phosphatases II [Glarea lozoyensis ATCC 20868]|uniref:protein-tyrosine-phosphatase n=1 Tax=Glarea lozoyensis (strain ATCC 20868 / MF5171) TaxID=1116229 RepID=S3E997_GLAL2|nr:(Phosphotyrosine protein) phosphatases II [Glarea lozoyensis ATCC 20868]EPE34848.1 (Phosphotyrosine protein) phosphatases II [Glarea lozoyensis ATCC 20868]
MQSLSSSSIAPIPSVPGLYISDRFAARSLPLLKSLNITAILSLTSAAEVPRFQPDAIEGLVQKHVDVDDDPTEDLFGILEDCCDWIALGLDAGKGVLVHCTQGISRSGSVVVAFVARKLKVDYLTALKTARKHRPQINPNLGFEWQLRIWIEMGCSVSEENGRDKKTYSEWKRARDELFGKGEEAVLRARKTAVGVAVARKGRLKGDGGEEEKEEGVEVVWRERLRSGWVPW